MEFGVDESLVIVDREIGRCGGREGRHLERAGQAFTVEYRHCLRLLVDLQQGARQRRVEAASLDLTFDAGESIWTESSYKYEPAGVVSMLEKTAFRTLGQWIDERARFALTLVEAE